MPCHDWTFSRSWPCGLVVSTLEERQAVDSSFRVAIVVDIIHTVSSVLRYQLFMHKVGINIIIIEFLQKQAADALTTAVFAICVLSFAGVIATIFIALFADTCSIPLRHAKL